MELYILYIVYRYGINRTYMMCVFAQSCRTLCGPLDSSTLRTCQAPLSMGFPRQEYWSELPFPSSGDLPDPGILQCLLHWQADSLPLCHLGGPYMIYMKYIYELSIFLKLYYKGLNCESLGQVQNLQGGLAGQTAELMFQFTS